METHEDTMVGKVKDRDGSVKKDFEHTVTVLYRMCQMMTNECRKLVQLSQKLCCTGNRCSLWELGGEIWFQYQSHQTISCNSHHST